MKYTREIHHLGLGKFKIISDKDAFSLERKAIVQEGAWAREYQLKLNKDNKQQKVNSDLEEIGNTLHSALDVVHAIDWEKLRQLDPFPKPPPLSPAYGQFPPEPQSADARFQVRLNISHKIFFWIAKQKIKDAHDKYLTEHAEWEIVVKRIEEWNKEQEAKYAVRLEEWSAEALRYQQEQLSQNESVDRARAAYEAQAPGSIAKYCEMVLENSEYNENYPRAFDFEYISGTKILVIDYSLPAPTHLPRVKEVKAKGKEVLLSERELNRLYDDLLYQICLRTIFELFDADKVDALSSIAFNGWVKSIDKATGKMANGCVLSIQVSKKEFQDIDLHNVEVKSCFKSLKGVGSSQLHSLTPVAPVMSISREDKRFIPSHDVAGLLDERSNLAAMDWEDFEQLVRELFEKEFSRSGGEVKVTRASRDGGVDAVVFDPDPIHGGKIVIQAKRYTNTVGVSFVRELYGTVINEGAMKGILITTADYGPDAHEFAKGKPITLMNGANLLYLLEKHGRKAKIDIKEAKQTLGEANFGRRLDIA